MNVYITGSSGVLGSALMGHLIARDYSLYCHENKVLGNNEEYGWKDKGLERFMENAPLEGVIHLEEDFPVTWKWSSEPVLRSFEEKIRSTRQLAEFLTNCKRKPKVVMVLSNVGYYGDRGERLLDETSFVGDSTYAEMYRQLEIATQPARQAGIRLIHLRPGMIIGPHINEMLSLFLPRGRFFTGVWGKGSHYLSWISIEDAVQAIEFILQNEDINGPVNLTSATPLTNRELTETLAAQPFSSLRTIPACIVRHLFDKITCSLVLSSCRALPKKLQSAGYTFRHPNLEEYTSTLDDIRSNFY